LLSGNLRTPEYASACLVSKQLLYLATIGALANHSEPGNICAIYFVTWILIADSHLKHLPPATTYNRFQRFSWIIWDEPGWVIFVCVELELLSTGFAMSKDHGKPCPSLYAQSFLTAGALNTLTDVMVRKQSLQFLRAGAEMRLHKSRTAMLRYHIHSSTHVFLGLNNHSCDRSIPEQLGHGFHFSQQLIIGLRRAHKFDKYIGSI
jgi:hypothetical protein